MSEDENFLAGIPCGPLVVDRSNLLTEFHEVTKYLCGKSKNKDYKVTIMYVPLVLPPTKKICTIEGPLKDPNVISCLMKLHPLAKIWALSLTESSFIR